MPAGPTDQHLFGGFGGLVARIALRPYNATMHERRDIKVALLLLAAVFLSVACGGKKKGSSTPPADTTPPAPGGGLALTAVALGPTSVSLAWAAASDDVTPASALEYQAVYSTANNLNTVTDAIANGTTAGSYAAAMTMTTVGGLAPSTSYYFNVIVRDAAGNHAIYAAAPATSSASAPIYVFNAGGSMGGDLGGRAGLDSVCSAKKSASFASLSCSNVVAFLSVSANDEIRDFPTTVGLPVSGPIVSATSSLTIAENFADLLDGSVARSMVGAGVVGGGVYWTGANADGSLAADNCTGWTGVGNGVTGDSAASDATWLDNGSGACGAAIYWLCLCW